MLSPRQMIAPLRRSVERHLTGIAEPVPLEVSLAVLVEHCSCFMFAGKLECHPLLALLQILTTRLGSGGSAHRDARSPGGSRDETHSLQGRRARGRWLGRRGRSPTASQAGNK